MYAMSALLVYCLAVLLAKCRPAPMPMLMRTSLAPRCLCLVLLNPLVENGKIVQNPIISLLATNATNLAAPGKPCRMP